MGKKRDKSPVSQGFNLNDLLKNIDLNQIISLVSSLVGANNMSTNQLSSMLRNFDLGDLNKVVSQGNLNENEVKSQLMALADRLDDIEKGSNNNVQDEVLKAVQNLQSSPDGQEILNTLLKSAVSGSKDSKR